MSSPKITLNSKSYTYGSLIAPEDFTSISGEVALLKDYAALIFRERVFVVSNEVVREVITTCIDTFYFAEFTEKDPKMKVSSEVPEEMNVVDPAEFQNKFGVTVPEFRGVKKSEDSKMTEMAVLMGLRKDYLSIKNVVDSSPFLDERVTKTPDQAFKLIKEFVDDNNEDLLKVSHILWKVFNNSGIYSAMGNNNRLEFENKNMIKLMKKTRYTPEEKRVILTLFYVLKIGQKGEFKMSHYMQAIIPVIYGTVIKKWPFEAMCVYDYLFFPDSDEFLPSAVMYGSLLHDKLLAIKAVAGENAKPKRESDLKYDKNNKIKLEFFKPETNKYSLGYFKPNNYETIAHVVCVMKGIETYDLAMAHVLGEVKKQFKDDLTPFYKHFGKDAMNSYRAAATSSQPTSLAYISRAFGAQEVTDLLLNGGAANFMPSVEQMVQKFSVEDGAIAKLKAVFIERYGMNSEDATSKAREMVENSKRVL